MELVPNPDQACDLRVRPLHLGRGSSVAGLDDFGWDAASLDAYDAATSDDGDDGRLVAVFDVAAGPGRTWERHPAGAEVVVCMSGALRVVSEVGDSQRQHQIGPGEAVVNPAGVWHVIDGVSPGQVMTITPGRGTEHRPRDA